MRQRPGLIAVHQAQPDNVPAAHELRLTLAELARIGPASFDPMDELAAIVREVP